MPLLRLDKIIADSGIATRSEAAILIKHGAVIIDGLPAVSGAVKLNPETAEILVNGEKLEYKKFRFVMMNKPAGYVSATEDTREQTVIDLLDDRYRKLGLFPAGRLDKDAEGLLILTNDGDFAHRVISPSKKVDKKYFVEIDGEINDVDISAFAAGIVLADGTKCRPAVLERCDGGAIIILNEGKYHQVKRMMAAAGKPVKYLKRIAIGGLILDNSLKTGEYRELTDIEIDLIFNLR